MNRISLYEAIRRKKDAEGLNITPQAGSVPQQTERMPRIQLKQPPAQGKSAAIPAKKPAVKSPIKPLFMTKKPVFHREKIYPWQIPDSLKEFIKNNSRTVWMGIAVGGVVLVLLVFLLGIKLGQGGAKIPPPIVSKDNKSQNVENVVSRKPQGTQSAAPRQEEKPAIQQRSLQVSSEEAVKPQAKSQLPPAMQNQLQKPAAAEKTQPPAKTAGTGDHLIVIAAYTKQEDLIPVGAYFRQNGIETEVLRQGSYYLLVTKERFENPEKAGTDGYKMKQTIKRIGANYKAPSGYEKFSGTPFQDVYGKKVK